MKPVSENKHEKPHKEMRGVQIVAVAAALIATVLLGIGLALPLRPTYSAS